MMPSMVFPIRSHVVVVAVAIGTASAASAGCKRDDAHAQAVAFQPLTSSVATVSAAGIRLKPAQGDLAKLVPTEAATARAKNLKPFVEVRADWCGPCRELEASMTDPLMVDAFAGTYIITLDADDWDAKQFASAGLDPRAIPVFFALDDQGKPTGRKINGGAWAENVPANMAPPLKAFFGGKS